MMPNTILKTNTCYSEKLPILNKQKKKETDSRTKHTHNRYNLKKYVTEIEQKMELK